MIAEAGKDAWGERRQKRSAPTGAVLAARHADVNIFPPALVTGKRSAIHVRTVR
ncbi:hypothetical protein OG373_39475 [Streptomyces avidinii]|uniref:hypothetical protein n=1 Tax=Streptomyces avidinii TaxID=1895 RepID=UPI00386F6AFE|nr:hypothetical protein OG373_39475 [Streptomyces avidinii]